MLDTLDLKVIRSQIEADKDRKAKFSSQNRNVLLFLFALFIVIAALDVQIWIFLPSAMPFFFGIVYLAYYFYKRMIVFEPVFARMRQVIARLLPEEHVTDHIGLPPRLGIEFALLTFALYVGGAFLEGYRNEGFEITLQNIVDDLSVAPQWALPFILSWSTALLIAVWWGYGIWRVRDKLRNAWARQLALYSARGIGLVMLLVDFGINFDQEFTLTRLVFVGVAWILISYSSLSWLVQWLMIRTAIYSDFVQGRYSAGISKLDWFLRILPGGFYLRYYRAMLLSMRGDYSEAEQMWSVLLKELQHGNLVNIVRVLLIFSHVKAKRGDIESAVRYAQSGVEIMPESSTAYAQLTDIYLEQPIYVERALELMRFTVDVNTNVPPLEQVLYALALAYNNAFDQTEEILKDVEEEQFALSAQKASWLYYRAVIDNLKGDTENARAYLEKALTTDPEGDTTDMRAMLEKIN